ncbi:MAG: SRPBCC domain-containing protein [Solirubrobacteraceae bacterium]
MTDRIERQLLLDAPPEEVWKVVTAPGWLADDVALDLFPGGDAHFCWRGSVKTGWVEEACPPTGSPTNSPTIAGPPKTPGRLAFWWACDGDPATRVELTLEPAGDGATRLTVVESRPLAVLDLIATPLPGIGGRSFGPALVAHAPLVAA